MMERRDFNIRRDSFDALCKAINERCANGYRCKKIGHQPAKVTTTKTDLRPGFYWARLEWRNEK